MIKLHLLVVEGEREEETREETMTREGGHNSQNSETKTNRIILKVSMIN